MHYFSDFIFQSLSGLVSQVQYQWLPSLPGPLACEALWTQPSIMGFRVPPPMGVDTIITATTHITIITGRDMLGELSMLSETPMMVRRSETGLGNMEGVRDEIMQQESSLLRDVISRGENTLMSGQGSIPVSFLTDMNGKSTHGTGSMTIHHGGNIQQKGKSMERGRNIQEEISQREGTTWKDHRINHLPHHPRILYHPQM